MACLAIRSLIVASALALSSALTAQGSAGCDVLAVDSGPFLLEGNLLHFVRPTIKQCNLKIEADDAFATGVEFEVHAEWRFTGHVRITAEGKFMEADSAVFVFDKNQVSRADLVGAPASFSASRIEPGKEPVRGSANNISFDYVAQTLRMSEHVVITKDRLRAQGCDVIYDFKNEGMRSGGADCAEDYNIRVVNAQPQANAAPAAPP
ncbi:MAG TPA: LptA/OstA family protein [Gammaproteobacteria bacterium]|nr:LptA/OstA family protein [Gammaproteobacteria bacterium]